MSCSASTSSSSQGGGQHSRVAFLNRAGLAAATTVAAVTASPILARAEEDDEVKVGEEVTTDSGLKYTVTVAGKGSKPSPGNTVKAHYTGKRVVVVQVEAVGASSKRALFYYW